jgi:hypothetical protein
MVRYRLIVTPIQEGTFIAVMPDTPRLSATRRTEAEMVMTLPDGRAALTSKDNWAQDDQRDEQE